MLRRGIKSISQLAREVGISESYARQIAAGMIPASQTRHRIATTLGVADSELWSTGPVHPEPQGNG